MQCYFTSFIQCSLIQIISRSCCSVTKASKKLTLECKQLIFIFAFVVLQFIVLKNFLRVFVGIKIFSTGGNLPGKYLYLLSSFHWNYEVLSLCEMVCYVSPVGSMDAVHCMIVVGFNQNRVYVNELNQISSYLVGFFGAKEGLHWLIFTLESEELDIWSIKQ